MTPNDTPQHPPTEGLVERLEAGIDGPKCSGCGGPHRFDTSLPSPQWNRCIRGVGLSDHLCTSCILLALIDAGESFFATLWGPKLNGVPIEVRINGAEAQTFKETEEHLMDRIGSLVNERDEALSALRAQSARIAELQSALADARRTAAEDRDIKECIIEFISNAPLPDDLSSLADFESVEITLTAGFVRRIRALIPAPTPERSDT